ncbi:MAG TPA: type II secretion system protein GspI [Pseudomonas xinjiangensis]|uniref:Type II secretion system protein I n=2 Tax=root TaxID=1 RepID=A0A7V1BN72_9GAMM|nr:type II secretion system protein GspI [Halopseudomonas xinjiangensis]HEC48033.1 type II secretion system protein GspI [Halopseudomonas xinjiangensis]
MRSRRNDRGFTLLEVLVALTILGVALAALVKGGADHARNTAYLQERTMAHWAGQNILAEYETGMRPTAEGNRNGEVAMGPYRFGFQVNISAYTPQAPIPLPAVQRIDVRLWMAELGEKYQRASVSGFVLP